MSGEATCSTFSGSAALAAQQNARTASASARIAFPVTRFDKRSPRNFRPAAAGALASGQRRRLCISKCPRDSATTNGSAIIGPEPSSGAAATSRIAVPKNPRGENMKQAFVGSMVLFASLALTGIAGAQVKVGVVVSATGPAASLGIPERNTVGLCSKTIGGKSIEYIVLDEASDTTTAVQNVKKLIGEDRVDAIIGTTTTPTTLAILDVIADGETPTISLASSIRIIEPMDAKRGWMFKTPQTDVMMAGAILEHMAKNGVKTIGYIGFNDALGEAFFAEIDKAAKARNIALVANERFAPKDTSVVGQSLKLLAAKPDAIVIGASGTPAALPARTLVEQGYKAKLYFNHGVANNDFLRVGGKDVVVRFVPTRPGVVAGQLPDSPPAEKQGTGDNKVYQRALG